MLNNEILGRVRTQAAAGFARYVTDFGTLTDSWLGGVETPLRKVRLLCAQLHFALVDLVDPDAAVTFEFDEGSKSRGSIIFAKPEGAVVVRVRSSESLLFIQKFGGPRKTLYLGGGGRPILEEICARLATFYVDLKSPPRGVPA